MDGPSTPEISHSEAPMGFIAVSEIHKTGEIPLLQEAAGKSGVVVNVLASEGQTYTTLPTRYSVDSKIKDIEIGFEPYTGTLGKDKNYVMISGTIPHGDLSDFWAEYRRLESERATTGSK